MRLTAKRVDELRRALVPFACDAARALRVAHDPIEIVRRYARPLDREVVALIAAALAYGRVESLRAKIASLLERIGESPAAQLRSFAPDDVAKRVRGFAHRMTTERDAADLLVAIGNALRRHYSLRDLFQSNDDGSSTIAPALSRFVEALRGSSPRPGLAFLLSSPADGSACKRMNLFLRWVVRPDDGVDLGLWPLVSPARLVIPLDTHVARIARYIGLTRRRTPNWAMAADVTDSLARLDPADPTRFDFALSHLGIAGDCPRKRDVTKCAHCDLVQICRL